jgi:hypothetical protein
MPPIGVETAQRQRRVERDRHDAGRRRTEEREHEFFRVGDDQRDAITLAQAERGELAPAPARFVDQRAKPERERGSVRVDERVTAAVTGEVALVERVDQRARRQAIGARWPRSRGVGGRGRWRCLASDFGFQAILPLCLSQSMVGASVSRADRK